MRQFDFFDKAILATEAIFSNTNKKQQQVIRKTPGNDVNNYKLSNVEKKHVAGLMRVNHAGEVCAQALYQGQALTAKLESVKEKMQKAAEEEIDHLAWCEERLIELDSFPSYLNPLWFFGSFFIGAVAGILGDKWSLGFVAETERQVGQHLKNHLALLPLQDLKTKAIIEQMYEDETKHANEAVNAGGSELPNIVKKIMSLASRVMTTSSYYI